GAPAKAERREKKCLTFRRVLAFETHDVDFCWRPGGLRALLTALRATLAEPLANYPPANAAAYKCWLERPRLYAQLARDCATASRRIAAGLPPAGEGRRGGGERRGEEDDDDEEVDRRAESDPGGGVPLRPPSDVSFENYYEQWRYVATSLPTDQTGCGRIIVSRSPRIKLTTAIVEEVTKRQHDILYGRFPDITKKSSQYQRLQKQVATERALRAARIFKLQKIYNLGELDQAEPAEEQVRITIPGVPGQSPFPLQKQPAASGAPPTREEEQAEGVVDSDRHPESQRLPDEFPAAAPKLDPPRDGDSVGGMERWEEEEADNLVQWSSSLDVKKFDEL
ncbi:MAG: hypothetical protein BJ554DRAFT_7166, partial [Olpidium bornovanus]